MNIKLTPDYKSLLQDCFITDPILLEKFHVYAGQGIDACVDKTFKDLKDCNVKIFQVQKDNELVGYFGREDLDEIVFLTGFFIVPKFRTPDYRQEFWNLVNKEIQVPFYCGLYEKNIPANKFIQSRGGHIIKQLIIEDSPVVVYQVGA